MTKTPNPAHTRMISSLTRSSLADAHCSMALKMRFILNFEPANPSGHVLEHNRAERNVRGA